MKELTVKQIGRMGGIKKWSGKTPEERRRIMKKVQNARKKHARIRRNSLSTGK